MQMTLDGILSYLGLWSVLGCALFSVYVVIVFRSGIVYTARREDGRLKERIPLSGYLNMLFFLLLIVGFQVVANYFGVVKRGYRIDFVPLLLLNYGHYVILFLFDTLVIDGLVLGVWRPGFLHMPDAMGGESMREHMTRSIPVGLVAGLALAALSTGISYTLMFRG